MDDDQHGVIRASGGTGAGMGRVMVAYGVLMNTKVG